jgi:hypothetical protein
MKISVLIYRIISLRFISELSGYENIEHKKTAILLIAVLIY